MKKSVFYLLTILEIFLFTGCMSINNPFPINQSSEVKVGYLSIKSINMNLSQQMPNSKRVGRNETNIVSITLFPSKDSKHLVVELELIFKSFEIPEGLPAIARTKALLDYNSKSREFKLSKIMPIEVRYLRESLLEYITPKQKKLISRMLTQQLNSFAIHKSKKSLGTIKEYSIKDDTIKFIFN